MKSVMQFWSRSFLYNCVRKNSPALGGHVFVSRYHDLSNLGKGSTNLSIISVKYYSDLANGFGG